MTERDFLSIEYLQSGSEQQQHAYRVLNESGIFTTLKKYTPVLTGTMPLDIFIDGSDLDICCQVKDFNSFEKDIRVHFEGHPGFDLRYKNLSGVDSLVCSFTLNEFVIEIVGQPLRVTNQLAFRHMIIEHSILSSKNESFKNEIIKLKRKGIKTEPAFAQLLGLTGDPYEALLTFTG